MESSKQTALGAAIVAVATLCSYVFTLAPGLVGGDDGELALVADAFSAAHPPGYPTWVVLAQPFARVPMGALALRLNLFSAVCGAGAAVFLFLALRRWTRSSIAAFAGALLFAGSPLAWTWSTRTEVFALDDLFAAALLWLAVRGVEAPGRRHLFAFAAVFAIGLGNHQTLVLLGAPLAIAVAWTAWRVGAKRDVFFSVAIGAVGTIAIYTLLPVLSARGGLESWGRLDSVDAVIAHVLRRDYGSLQLASSGTVQPGTLWQELSAFAVDHARELLLVGIVPAVQGAWLAVRGRSTTRPFGIALGAAWLLCVVAFHALARFPVGEPLFRAVLARFWLLPLMVSCAFVARGVAWWLVRSRREAEKNRSDPGSGASLRTRRMVLGAAVIVIAAQFARTASAEERTRPWGHSPPEEYARAALEQLPERAIVLARGDLIHNALRYEQHAHGVRPDVVLLDSELMTYAWYVRRAKERTSGVVFPGDRYGPNVEGAFSLAQFVEANGARPVFIAGGVKTGDASLNGRYDLVPYGLTEQLVDARDPNLAGRIRASLETSDALSATEFGRDVLGSAGVSRDPWRVAFFDEYWEARHRPALALLREGMARDDQQLLQQSVTSYRALIAAHPSPPAAYFKNLGLACWRAHDPECARTAFSKFLELAPPDDADRPAITEAVRGNLEAP